MLKNTDASQRLSVKRFLHLFFRLSDTVFCSPCAPKYGLCSFCKNPQAAHPPAEMGYTLILNKNTDKFRCSQRTGVSRTKKSEKICSNFFGTDITESGYSPRKKTQPVKNVKSKVRNQEKTSENQRKQEYSTSILNFFQKTVDRGIFFDYNNTCCFQDERKNKGKQGGKRYVHYYAQGCYHRA